jgi:small subunit ribosomal protein S18
MADEVKNPTNAGETAAPETPQAPTPATPAPHARESRGPGGPRREGGPRPGGRDGGRKFFRRKKVCKFCVEKIDAIDYKDVRLLSQFVAERGKIVPRRLTGVCTPHQRRLSTAIKQARNIALLPFAARY